MHSPELIATNEALSPKHYDPKAAVDRATIENALAYAESVVGATKPSIRHTRASWLAVMASSRAVHPERFLTPSERFCVLLADLVVRHLPMITRLESDLAAEQRTCQMELPL